MSSHCALATRAGSSSNGAESERPLKSLLAPHAPVRIVTGTAIIRASGQMLDGHG